MERYLQTSMNLGIRNIKHYLIFSNNRFTLSRFASAGCLIMKRTSQVYYTTVFSFETDNIINKKPFL